MAVQMQAAEGPFLRIYESWDGDIPCGPIAVAQPCVWRVSGSTEPAFPTGSWVQVCWTRDASSRGNIPHLYLNGVNTRLVPAGLHENISMLPYGNYLRPGAHPQSVSSSIGWSAAGGFQVNDPGAWQFRGQIDEVAIWNLELSTDNVTEIYNGGTVADLTASSIGRTGTGIHSWYRMGDGVGDTDGIGGIIHDIVGPNNMTASSNDGVTNGPIFNTDVLTLVAASGVDCNEVTGGTAQEFTDCGTGLQVCIWGDTGLTKANVAEPDCLGVCEGTAVRGCIEWVPTGCYEDPAAASFVNECGWCVGGDTGRPATFGMIGGGPCWNGVIYCAGNPYPGGIVSGSGYDTAFSGEMIPWTCYIPMACPENPFSGLSCKPVVGQDFVINTFWNRGRADPRNVVQGPFILGTNSIEALNTNIGTGSYAITGTC